MRYIAVLTVSFAGAAATMYLATGLPPLAGLITAFVGGAFTLILVEHVDRVLADRGW